MTRKECLDAAAGCVLKDRNASYGGPEDSFGLISSLWSAYLGVDVDKVDVAMMMGMLKMARIRNNKGYADGFVDLAGYAACGAECADGKPAPKAEGGKQEFKPGDRVQYHVTLPSVSDGMWVDAEYEGRLSNGREHAVKTEKLGLVVVDGKDIRPAPKTEGCEELVQKDEAFDAPQTKEELLERIRDVNPAIFKGFSE